MFYVKQTLYTGHILSGLSCSIPEYITSKRFIYKSLKYKIYKNWNSFQCLTSGKIKELKPKKWCHGFEITSKRGIRD